MNLIEREKYNTYTLNMKNIKRHEQKNGITD